MFGLFRNNAVHELFEDDPKLGSAFDVRDLSDVPDVAIGWVLNDSGALSPPATFTPAISIPDISSAQAKIQLRRANLRDKVDAIVAKADGEVRDWYSDARTWQRSSPYVAQIGKALGLTATDIDALFVEASKIVAA